MRVQALGQYRPEVTFHRKYFVTVGLVAVVYAVAAKFGLSLAHATVQVTSVWPASGIALVVLLVLGRRYWPGIFLGAFVANALTAEPLWVAAGIAVGNTLEAVAGAFLLKRWANFKTTFRRPADAIWYALASILSTLIAAVIGPAFLAWGGLINWADYGRVALVWWQGDLMGDLVFGPFLLVYIDRTAFNIARNRLLEGGLLLASTFAACILVFTSDGRGPLAFPYLLFPFLMWAAVRFTKVGVVTCSLLIAAVSIWATANGMGPFLGRTSLDEDLVQVQVYVAIVSATSLVLAMAMAEEIEAREALRRQTEQLERLDAELKEANKRMTNMLAGVLDESTNHRRGSDRDLGT